MTFRTSLDRLTVNKIRATDLSNRLHDQHSNLGSHENGSQCGPSVPGSRLDADHPENGVLIPCRNTDEAAISAQWPRERMAWRQQKDRRIIPQPREALNGGEVELQRKK